MGRFIEMKNYPHIPDVVLRWRKSSLVFIKPRRMARIQEFRAIGSVQFSLCPHPAGLASVAICNPISTVLIGPGSLWGPSSC